MPTPNDIAMFVSAIAAIQDLKQFRISNHLTYPAILTGLVWHFRVGTWDGLAHAALGVVLPLVILFPIFLVNGFGAGDVKLFMALGAWLGPRSIANVMLISLTVNGLVSGAILLARHSPSLMTRVSLSAFGRLLDRVGLGLRRREPEANPAASGKTTETIPLAVIVLIGMVLVFHFHLDVL